MSDTRPDLGIGMVGYAFMGAAHSQAWRTAPSFFDLPMTPRLTAISGRDEAAAADVARRFGWQSVETDWRALLTRDDIDVIDICTPGHTHAEIAIAALEAGKHVLCEKPLANTVAEAEAMADAAAAAAERGVRAMCGFTYRRTPAVALARQLVASGRIGTIRHVRGQYLQDWLADEDVPLSWRLDKQLAGSGALGDIGAHIIDMAQFVSGDSIASVNGLMETFVPTRPVAGDHATLGGTSSSTAERGPVTVDDAAAFTARFVGGAIGVFEATRFATGRKNAMRLEINGTLGSIAFDFEDMNVLELFDATEDPSVAGFRRILVTEATHPYIAAWWPPGHGLGYEHGFTHQVVDLVTDIAKGADPAPSFADGLAVQRVLAAVEASATDGTTHQIGAPA
ncbi:Gfo/Idh/MocA family protein [Aeromicrobium wangtongii]|uniref:Gfo/Idh/MocA family oxidoreductase n=1 Tax=Aeromicrobium wangtongii TaxID=2969247 RepID=A0ABY5M905_9ACTN|nr:Gfo/Idh/MocA family oxidoreductase [Aeromicrobium wangtongii]MCD9197116.1 Gfo/Idh/MocA family oxidoreductase [Aeromicrobium wangtongii]UUP14614.1 Gfo/Idh/MocA family oxidoreductase [Aeromicrobium wangtongii]